MSIPGITIYDAPKGPKDQVLPVQSALLAQFAADQAIKSPDRPSRKWELMDVKQHMVEFCGDQAGSRFIQKKIETANSDERAIVFAELYDNLLQLMKDVFGNYVIQKLFEHGDQNQKKMMADKMRTHVGDLATSMFGCRVLQKAFEFVLTDQQVELAQELRGDVYKCVMDQQGNHVIQRVIERVPPEHWQFIVNESRGHLAEMSQNQYGCRVVQRMLDYCDASLQAAMLDELVPQGEKLITDTYGNYVAQHIIIKGPEKESSKMVEYVKKNWFQYSKHKFASNVVERVLVYKGDDVRRYIMCAVLDLCTLSAPTGPANGHAREHNCALQQLIRDNYGNYVVSKILGTLPDADHALFVARLQPEMDRARKSVGAKQLAAMELKMHNRCDIETFERGFTGDPDKRANGPPGRARDVRTPVRGSGHRNGINPQAQPFGVPSGPAYRGSFGGVAPAGPGAGAGQPARSPLPRGGSAGAGASAAADGQERTQSPPATNGVNGHAFGGAS
ncbi:ARM repeat-containing protein [Trichodelitschia bisporula]|uniref:ARM repeat-containing protein n=1 Tax=Trichodelitschia bisporula TaxID=703511 RepID=A0A6G1HMJ6_9PEZI|nr:ARM repeat-containing protein [Trichodelitschia bisporula]